ncbi:MAG: cyclic-di-AMP receptor [Peptococcaceae bacterium]|jgi:uncharacterized protein YaaQ|nr:cyclic-di-AMP receptor [Peptococcaceae bacterium]
MKLIICVIDDMDIHALLDALAASGHRATKLASSGGFLRRGNTTLLIGTNEEKKDDVIQLIRRICRPRKQMVPIAPVLAAAESVAPAEMLVRMGGAMVFVLDVAESYKV